MIVPMKRAFVVGRARDRARLLDALRAAGVLHPVPLGPGLESHAAAAAEVERLERAVEVLAPLAPSGAAPDLAPEAAADEAIGLGRSHGELGQRLAAVQVKLDALAPWGDLRLADVEALHAQGVHLEFATLPEADVGRVRAELVVRLGDAPGGRVLVGVAGRGPVDLPASAEVLELPPTDRPTLRHEAEALRRQHDAAGARLGQLRHLLPALRDRAVVARAAADAARVADGALADGALFGVQGWIPADAVRALEARVAGAGLGAVQTRDPDDSEQPPTLLRPPAWARSVSGLMGVLGLSPGYREVDVSVPFMIAVPVFAAILISDAGYGAVVALGPLLFWRRATAALGRPLAQFLVITGAAAVVWGALTGSVFGVDVAQLLTGGPPPIVVRQEDEAMRLLMRLSFTIGVVHLSLAQTWRAALLLPSPAALGRVGWAAFLWGMYGVVTMFVLKTPFHWGTPWPWCLAVGGALAVLFGAPERNVLRGVLMGLANFPLTALGTFSDVMSYVRLMAVGLAGSVLASSFNDLAASAGPVLQVPILFFGHSLNLGLCLIALFAHGVRLNVLEFSNNFGLEWGGYAYEPFQAPAGATTQRES